MIYNKYIKFVFNIILTIFYFSLNKKNRPKISLFIPTYNKENFIDRCLESIQNQTLKDIEIIFVNDKSNDSTLEKLIEISKRDKRIKIVNNARNHGLLYSRAMGILSSSGEYIMNIDADDELESGDSLEYIYNKAFYSKADIINFNILNNGNKNIVKKCTEFNEIQKNPEFFKRLFGADNIVYDGLIWNKLYGKIHILFFKFVLFFSKLQDFFLKRHSYY